MKLHWTKKFSILSINAPAWVVFSDSVVRCSDDPSTSQSTYAPLLTWICGSLLKRYSPILCFLSGALVSWLLSQELCRSDSRPILSLCLQSPCMLPRDFSYPLLSPWKRVCTSLMEEGKQSSSSPSCLSEVRRTSWRPASLTSDPWTSPAKISRAT